MFGSLDEYRPSDEIGLQESTVVMENGTTGSAADEEMGDEIWTVNL